MKQFYLLLVALVFLSFTEAMPQSPPSVKGIDLSSVDKFFEITDKISAGESITDKEWEELLCTKGYQIMATYKERKDAIRDITLIAFSPNHAKERDSILNIGMDKILADQTIMMRRYMLENYLDMQKKYAELKKARNTYDFNALIPRATVCLKEFMINPVDSFISAPPISMVCMELEAMSLNGGIVWDFNLFMRGDGEAGVKLLAHEMFHTYSSRYISQAIGKKLPADPLFAQINMLRNEGIADLIDKSDDYSIQMKESGLPKELTNYVLSAYEKTPEILEQFQNIVLSYKNKVIDEADYKSKLRGYFKFAGHPNGFYMTQTIRDAGMLSELLSSFWNPVAFVNIYNKAASQKNRFVFCNEFTDYMAELYNR